jgi:hypothetical protein
MVISLSNSISKLHNPYSKHYALFRLDTLLFSNAALSENLNQRRLPLGSKEEIY